MAFFDPPQPPAPRPAPQPPPVWAGPPANTLPAALATTVVLGRTDDTVVALTGLAVYPTGCDLRLEVRSRRQDIEFPFGFAHHHGRPADGLLVGVLFSDGRKASCPNTASGMGAQLTPRNGSGGGGAFTQDLWLWPLPPAGAVELFVAWPELGIPESSAVLDGAAVLTAAGQSVELWAPASAPETDNGWYAFGGTSGPPGVAMPAPQVVLPAAGTPPADSEAATAGVRTAFEKAFTAVDGGPLEVVVQDGAVLAGALAQARSNFPRAVGTAWVGSSRHRLSRPRPGGSQLHRPLHRRRRLRPATRLRRSGQRPVEGRLRDLRPGARLGWGHQPPAPSSPALSPVAAGRRLSRQCRPYLQLLRSVTQRRRGRQSAASSAGPVPSTGCPRAGRRSRTAGLTNRRQTAIARARRRVRQALRERRDCGSWTQPRRGPLRTSRVPLRTRRPAANQHRLGLPTGAGGFARTGTTGAPTAARPATRKRWGTADPVTGHAAVRQARTAAGGVAGH